MSEVKLSVNGTPFQVKVLERSHRAVRFLLGGRDYRVEFEEEVVDRTKTRHCITTDQSLEPDLIPLASQSSPGTTQILAPISGIVIKILKYPGSKVVKGEAILRLEAMKMENSIFAPCGGTLTSLEVREGAEVREQQLLGTIG